MSGGNTEKLESILSANRFLNAAAIADPRRQPCRAAGAEINLRGDATMRLAAPSYTADVWSF
ncbi:MAG: hypothetical protein AABZ12_14900 [Planctomycetota bacterium]